MSIGISSGWNRALKKTRETTREYRMGWPYVCVDVYGPRPKDGGGPPDEAELGAALGTLYRAADAALAFDPYGKPSIHYKPINNREFGSQLAHLVLEFKASSDDVVTGGPLHFNRAARCLAEMYRVVETAFDERSRMR